MADKKQTAASEARLGELHALVAEYAIALLGRKDEEGRVVGPSASDMTWIRSFLKDNDITASADTNEKIEELKARMQELRKQRAGSAPPATGTGFDPEADLPTPPMQ